MWHIEEVIFEDEGQHDVADGMTTSSQDIFVAFFAIRGCWRRFDDIVFVVPPPPATQFPLSIFVVLSSSSFSGFLLLPLLLLTNELKLCNNKRSSSSWSKRKHSRRMERPRCIAAGCSPGWGKCNLSMGLSRNSY